MNDDGTMARVPDLTEFCARHNSGMISVADLIRYRLQTERFIQRQSEGCLRTEFGDFKTIVYASSILPEKHMALVHGEISGEDNILVRMHSHCIFGDVFGSLECECLRVIRPSLERITRKAPECSFIFIRPGRGFAITPASDRPIARSSSSMKAESARRFSRIWVCGPFVC